MKEIVKTLFWGAALLDEKRMRRHKSVIDWQIKEQRGDSLKSLSVMMRRGERGRRKREETLKDGIETRRKQRNTKPFMGRQKSLITRI